MTLRSILTSLRRSYGDPAPPISRDPFRLILWEQVAYLVPDNIRRKAYAALRSEIGLAPLEILAASAAKLRAIARLGGPIGVDLRAGRMRRSAEIVVERWEGDLDQVLRLPLPQARRELGRFAMIGEPGADKILVFAKRARLLPLDSNGLRVLRRVGLVPEGRDYRASYRRAQEAVAPMLPKDADALIAAYQLLRRHGQELCRRSAPECDLCPLRSDCVYAARSAV